MKGQAVAKAVGLPNWDTAASPCLRSRLAPFVPAHEQHLKIVELCEEKIRLVLGEDLHRSDALRVRMIETPDMDWDSGLKKKKLRGSGGKGKSPHCHRFFPIFVLQDSVPECVSMSSSSKRRRRRRRFNKKPHASV